MAYVDEDEVLTSVKLLATPLFHASYIYDNTTCHPKQYQVDSY